MQKAQKKCYLSAEKQFLNFCHGFKIHEVQPLFPANELTICYFAFFLAKSVKHCTIKGYLSAIKHLHLKHGFDLKLHKFVRLQYILRGIKRYQGQEMRTRLPISLVHLELFYTLLHSQKVPDWNSKMLWAAICLAFFGFLRISEFTTSQQFYPAYNLCSGDVTFVPSIISPTAVRIGLKCSKTDPFRKGVCLTLGQTGSHICAVKALHEYIVTCRPAQGPLFQFQDGKPLRRDIFTKEIRNLLKRGGYEPMDYAGHSFRIGAATTAAAKNFPPWLIKTLGRWTSDCFERYIRTPESVLINASKDLVRSP